jgi:hypothetical protein
VPEERSIALTLRSSSREGAGGGSFLRVGVTGAVAPNKSIDGVLDRFYRAPARPDRRAGDAQAARRLSCRSRGRSPCGRSSGRSSSLRPRDRGEGRLDPAIIGRSAPSPF